MYGLWRKLLGTPSKARQIQGLLNRMFCYVFVNEGLIGETDADDKGTDIPPKTVSGCFAI